MTLVSAATLILGIAPAATPAPAIYVAVDTVVITEWLVPYEESRPRDPYVAPDGRVWFVGQRSDYAAVFDPDRGEFERFDLPEGAGPHNLGPSGTRATARRTSGSWIR
jgi:virginiamycin B lyase